MPLSAIRGLANVPANWKANTHTLGHHLVVTHPGASLANLTDGRSQGVLMWLTPRERQVAIAVAAGASNQQVAAALSLPAKTVECHLGRIYTQLGVASRVELAVAIGNPSRLGLNARWPDLSPTQQHVAILLGVGMTTRRAAKRLYLSAKTVEYHPGNIYRKLEITSRRQLLDVVARPIPQSECVAFDR